MNRKKIEIVLGFALGLFLAAVVRAQPLTVVADKTDGVYRVGDTVHWQVDWKGTSALPAAHFRCLQGQLTETAQGDLKFTGPSATLETTFGGPGTMFVEVKWKSADGTEGRATAGAVAAPERIALSASRPADFDAFWAAKLRELAAVPTAPQLEAGDSGRKEVGYWKVTLDNIRSTHIYGQLARPTEGEKFPALLIVQWAGVYGLQRSWVTDRAAAGWLVLNIEPHDLPFDQPEDFYKQQQSVSGPLHDYWRLGNDDRDTSYYLRMYLSCYRAADYLASRADWDGRTLVVMGGSQGGLQALMTAGFYPRITAALAMVPAGCDMLGPVVGRRGGWPQWYNNTEGRDPVKVREASRYYDVANFAPAIKCPVLVGLGLIDETCPAEGIFAAFNQITSAKEVVVLPRSGHQDENGSQRVYQHRADEVWLPALRQGHVAPVNQ